MTRTCETCRHFDIDPLAAAPVCDVSLTFAAVERRRTHRTACGAEGWWWQSRETAAETRETGSTGQIDVWTMMDKSEQPKAI